MYRCLAVAAALALTGCAGFGGSTMSPEAMAQNVKDKNAVVGCIFGTGLYGRGGAVYVDTNKLAPNTGVSVDGECKVTVTGTANPK